MKYINAFYFNFVSFVLFVVQKKAKDDRIMGFMDDTPTIRGKGSQRPKAVIYHVIVCPVCKCRDCPITSSPPPEKDAEFRTRHHKCNKCEHNFKSIQRI